MNAAHCAIRRLELGFALTAEERGAFASCLDTAVVYPKGMEIVRAGDAPACMAVLLEGFACRHVVLEDSSFQTLALCLPGDICDLNSLVLAPLDHSLRAKSDCTMARIPHATLMELTQEFPRLTLALVRQCMLEAARVRRWLVNIGSRGAYERLGQLFCETQARLGPSGQPTAPELRFH